MILSRKSQELGLGTVQFGLAYGVANESGRVPVDEAVNITRFAGQVGLSLIDTASAYGESELIVGQCLRAVTNRKFKVVTKTVPLRTNSVGDADLQNVQDNFLSSLSKIGPDSVYGLMVHHANDLLVPGGERLFEQLLHWRDQGLVEKIGVSIYDKIQIDQLFAKYSFDLVQLPLNIFDQRLLNNGALSFLHDKGVEVHARSLLLQGVLLMPPEKLPAHLKALSPFLIKFQTLAMKSNMTPLAAAFSFVKQLKEVSVALVGVLSVAHLKECMDAYESKSEFDYLGFSQTDDFLIDPRCWPNISR